MVKNLMNSLLDHRKWLLPLLCISCLVWAWQRVHWDAAEALTATPEETLRWNYHSEPCNQMIAYFNSRGFNLRPTVAHSSVEFKENAILLRNCWSRIQQQSQALNVNMAGGLIPKEYTGKTISPVSLVQQFYPTMVLPSHGAETSAAAMFTQLADQLLNGENTDQIRALGYGCQSPPHAQKVKAAIATQPEVYSRGWYVLQMLEHCQRDSKDRQRYMRTQWKEHPKAHAFLMLEWSRYFGALPSDFTASEDPIEQAIAHFINDMS
ncbi:MAG: hypothetical protein ACON4U_05420 [Myxococcota bacterium]